MHETQNDITALLQRKRTLLRGLSLSFSHREFSVFFDLIFPQHAIWLLFLDFFFVLLITRFSRAFCILNTILCIHNSYTLIHNEFRWTASERSAKKKSLMRNLWISLTHYKRIMMLVSLGGCGALRCVTIFNHSKFPKFAIETPSVLWDLINAII